jgi:hypothetical protein
MKRKGSEEAADRKAASEASFPKVRASQNINRTAKVLSDESVFDDAIMDLEKAKGHGSTTSARSPKRKYSVTSRPC